MNWDYCGTFPLLWETSLSPHSVGEVQEVSSGDWGESSQHCVVNLVFSASLPFFEESDGVFEFSHGEIMVDCLGLGIIPCYPLRDFMLSPGCRGCCIVFCEYFCNFLFGGYGIVALFQDWVRFRDIFPRDFPYPFPEFRGRGFCSQG